jgi:hypothetical protein
MASSHILPIQGHPDHTVRHLCDRLDLADETGAYLGGHKLGSERIDFAIQSVKITMVTLCAVLILFSSQTFALTLFIDFNNAESEIQAFRLNGNGKPHDLLVLPSYERISISKRSAALRANARLDRWTLVAQQCALSERVKSSHCNDVYTHIRQAELDRVAATGSYTFQDLKIELGLLQAGNPDLRFDMLVVSGHHETGFYSGELSQATERQFAELIKSGSLILSDLNTVVLLGCGTGSKNAYAEFLSPLFPKTTLVVGAEDSAPTRDEARNLAFIRKLNASRPKLLQVRTAKQIEPIFRSLLAEGWPVSLLWRNSTLFLKGGAEPF